MTTLAEYSPDAEVEMFDLPESDVEAPAEILDLANAKTQTGTEPHDRQEPDKEALVAYLSKWLNLSEAQRRVLTALCTEIDVVNDLVENSTSSIVSDFQSLAQNAVDQSRRIEDLVASQDNFLIDNETLSMNEAMSRVEMYLSNLINRTLEISTESISMVYALDDVMKDVHRVDKLVEDVEKINTQTSYLSINAMIEAQRAGEAGRGFQIVAREMRVLSNQVRDLATKMRSDIITVTNGIREGHASLQKVARIDMTENYQMRDQLNELMADLMKRNKALSAELESTGEMSASITSDVGKLITNIQFQDRTSQRLGNLKDTLATMSEASQELASDPIATDLAVEADEEWLRHLIEERSLGEIRNRFVRVMLNEDEEPEGDAHTNTESDDPQSTGTDDDDIILF